MINAQKEKIVGARTKEIFQLIKEHINLKSGHSQRQLLLMYCTPYLFGLKMKVSWTGASKGVLKIRTFNSLFWSFSLKEQYNLPLGTSHSNSLAVCLYNSGMEYTISSLLKQANMEVDKNLKKAIATDRGRKIIFRELQKPGRYEIKTKITKMFTNKKLGCFSA